MLILCKICYKVVVLSVGSSEIFITLMALKAFRSSILSKFSLDKANSNYFPPHWKRFSFTLIY